MDKSGALSLSWVRPGFRHHCHIHVLGIAKDEMKKTTGSQTHNGLDNTGLDTCFTVTQATRKVVMVLSSGIRCIDFLTPWLLYRKAHDAVGTE